MNIGHQLTVPNGTQGIGVSMIAVNGPIVFQSPAPVVPMLVISDQLRADFAAGAIEALVCLKGFHKGDAIQIITDDGKRFVIGYWEGEMPIKELDADSGEGV
jgi:hypothetical protein